MSANEFASRYRLHAAHCVERAERISDAEGRLALFAMAQSWLALAEQATKNSETRVSLRDPYPEGAMSRWREHVDNLLSDLQTETPGAGGFRVNIDQKIWGAEQKVSKAAPTTVDETTVWRLHGFQRELIETLSRKRDFAGSSILT
jgi:hypothetical protein